MTRTKKFFTPARRWSAGLALAAVVVSGVLSPDAVDASRRTSSDVIAQEADRAVTSFHRWEASRSPIDYIRFVRARDLTAELVEGQLEAPTGSLVEAWSSASAAKQQALLAAISQLGVPYHSITSKPGVSFDCSGLTMWAYSEAGLEIPRVSRDQISKASAVEADEAEAGDLVYYPGHVSIFLGADLIVHSPQSGSTVEITDLPEKSLRFGDAVAGETSSD